MVVLALENLGPEIVLAGEIGLLGPSYLGSNPYFVLLGLGCLVPTDLGQSPETVLVEVNLDP